MQIDPSQRAEYRKEMQEGVKIFEESFKGLQQTDFAPKRKEYEKSINESLDALQDIAKALVNKKLMQMKEQLSTDYQHYLEDPSKENQAKVEKDIADLKKE